MREFQNKYKQFDSNFKKMQTPFYKIAILPMSRGQLTRHYIIQTAFWIIVGIMAAFL